MAKTLEIMFPKLKAKMAYNGTTTAELADVLKISEDSVRRRLRGAVEFELPEVIKLMKFFRCSFEDLFGHEAA